ncbi:hypothetical protein PBAL39_21860 [Pedobacter sp. BAL39]|uniref:hypothetical protein n=1 Tax=Pedobacter sp. BAL39 TaxID=391596 RepID=UPI000155A096|nr:hypothetical protein [Pedobacter sp. BAL39]EDM38763.1 hypothetical protein PBAL39_21860 [Pedobacter sp. BAL39]
MNFFLSTIIMVTAMGFVLVPLFVSIFKFRSYTTALRIITLHLVLISFIGGYSAYLWALKKNNLPVLHIYTMVEFTTIMLFYAEVFKDKIKRKWTVAIIGGFISFCLINAEYIQNWFVFNTYPRALQSFVIICACLYYYYQITHQTLYIQIEKSPIFWINTGFFIYFSGSFLLFMLSNYILRMNSAFNMNVWMFHAFLSILMYTLIAVGLWQTKKT